MKKVKLGSIADISISNVDKKSKENERIVRLCNFTDVYYNWAITDKLYSSFMVATANDNQIKKFSLKKGYVAITKDSETRDDIGVSAYIADNFNDVVLGYHCVLISPHKNDLDGAYLNALLHTSYAQKYFEAQASGSGQRYTLTDESVKNFLVPNIDLPTQRRIAKVLSTIDAKIANNNAVCAELEAMAKQLYDYWFVQFDFPDKNGKPYKSSGGKMVYNETLKREIPEGWEVKALLDFADFKNGINYSKDDVGDSQYRIVNVRNITATNLVIDSYECDLITLLKNNAEKYLIDEKDIMIARSGTPGAVRILMHPENNVVFSGFIICCSIRNLLFKNYVVYSLKKYELVTESQSGGSILANISQDVLKKLSIIEPRKEIIEEFNSVSNTILDKIYFIHGETRQLTALRDFLLPMLMNGQVEVGA